jgi:hypothetical protein
MATMGAELSVRSMSFIVCCPSGSPSDGNHRTPIHGLSAQPVKRTHRAFHGSR